MKTLKKWENPEVLELNADMTFAGGSGHDFDGVWFGPSGPSLYMQVSNK